MTSPADEPKPAAPAASAAEGAAPAGDEQDDLAAEWEAMVGEGEEGAPAGAPRESTRVLNQEEIDSLLGFDEEHEEGGEKSGIQAILSSALVSYERLPMLEVVFDRLVRMMSTTAFGGRRLGEAADVLELMARDRSCFKVLTVSGAMTVAKQGLLVCSADALEHVRPPRA